MEGPAFSTRAESLTNRKLGYDVIGMTNLGEAKCAREAEIAYATMAMVTDYDCWKDDEAHVTVEMVIANLMKNAAMAKAIIAKVLPQIPAEPNWPCHDALKNAIMTDRKFWPAKTMREAEADLAQVSVMEWLQWWSVNSHRYAKKTIIKPAKSAPAVGPYNHAVRVGDLLFCAGQIPLDPATGNLVTGDIKAQTERVLENVKAILEDQKLTFANVVKSTVFLTNLADFAGMNEVYAKYFTADFPARSTIQVAALPKGANVEIEVIAHF